MRIVIDIPDQTADALTEIVTRRKTSRAGNPDATFGLWGKSVGDGLAW
jgi:hypothetical protein